MSAISESVANLSSTGAGAAGEAAHLAWEHPLPAWAWGLIFCGAALAAFFSYTRLAGPRAVRGALAIVRALTLVLLAALISGPMWETPRYNVEEDWVLMLVDRSRSMSIADEPGAVGVRTRDDQLRTVLSRADETVGALAADRHVHWLGFHTGAFRLEGSETAPELGGAEGEGTDIGSAIDQALRRAAARPVSGIVVFSDGRSPAAIDPAVRRRLQSENIQVHVVPLGSSVPVGDLALGRVEAPRRAFVRDKVPVVVEVDAASGAVPEDAVLRLVDEATGETLDERAVHAQESGTPFTLVADPKIAGEARWRVEIHSPRPDLAPANNVREVLVDLVDRPLRVLFVEGYPRWEYRYLKNLLIREKSIESSVILLSADRDFAQEGNVPITRLPRAADEWSRFDVVVMGDAPASFFTTEQQEQMRDLVASRGAGLLWIGGPRSTPGSWAQSALADLLPFRGELDLPAVGAPVNLQPTEFAEQLGVLQFVSASGSAGWPAELTDSASSWARLWYVQRIDPKRLKPAAEVLAKTYQPIDGEYLPVVVNLRYGAGQAMYVATDEIWRWRYGRGDALPDQFWIGMIRMLGRESLAVSGHWALLQVEPRRVEIRQSAHVVLRVLDGAVADALDDAIEVAVTAPGGRDAGKLTLRQRGDAPDRFEGTLVPDQSGAWRLNAVTAPGIAAVPEAVLEVFARDEELRLAETDHHGLATLAEQTGGSVLHDAALSELKNLSRREVRTYNPIRERLWDTPAAFAAIVILLTLEWIGRRVIRLV